MWSMTMHKPLAAGFESLLPYKGTEAEDLMSMHAAHMV